MKRTLLALFSATLWMGAAQAITATWSSDSIDASTEVSDLNVKAISIAFTLTEGASGAIFQVRQGANANAAASNRLSLGIDAGGALVLQMLGASGDISNQQSVTLSANPAAGTHTLNVTLREEAGREGQNRYWAYYVFDGGEIARLQSGTAQTVPAALDTLTFLSQVKENPNGLSDASGIAIDAFSAYGEMLSDEQLRAVPEPTALAVLALGFAGAMLRRKAA